MLILADIEGTIHLLDSFFNKAYSFGAHFAIIQIEQVKEKNILVTLGTDEENIQPILKFWNLDNLEDGYPELISVRKLFPAGVPATCFAVNSDLSHIAIGMCDGSVILIYDPLRDRYTPRQLLIKKHFPVTGLGYLEDKHKSKGMLYVVTADQVVLVDNTSEGVTQVKLDDYMGGNLRCSVVNQYNDLVIGRKEGIFFYNTFGKGPCRAFEGDHKILNWFRNYLIVVDQSPNNPKLNTIAIYHLPPSTGDVENKFIAYNGSFQNVSHVVCEWNQIIVIQEDGNIFRLIEKDIQTKLELLFRRSLYQVALDMAFSSNYDSNSIVEIIKEYGDHLYDKGDYNGAIDQYIKAIGNDGLEPSYVIKQFLDAQRIHNLTLYLQKLHEKGCANSNHTTLLLNCYTRLKDSEKLREFIKHAVDVETAIRVCRQSNYHEEALELADTHKAHHWYLKILLEDLGRDKQALDYISKLQLAEAEEVLKKYGKALVATLPAETTELIIQVCTQYKIGVIQGALPPKDIAGQFVNIFVNQTTWLIKFLEHISESDGTPTIYTTLLELYLRDGSDKDERREKALSLLRKPEANFDTGHALVLCQMSDFKQGQIILLERLELYDEIIQYYMDNNEYENVLKACKKYAKNDVWIKALTYFANIEPQTHFEDILRNIEKNNLLPPLRLIKLLSDSSPAKIGLVKNYISKYISKEKNEIAEDSRQLRKNQDETKKNMEEIKELKAGAKLFLLQKCTRCKTALYLPAVHFLCNHSFHQHCVGDDHGDYECAFCVKENKDFANRKRDMEQKKQNEFFARLEKSEDGFKLVSDYFGFGLFNKNSSSTLDLDQGLPALKDLNLKLK
uniref:Vacuolar protein sorting-associated protein 11 homolog n=1 Tax=Arcella intermedia TaxID=1963864 RepID=A0A6B2KXR1_9EUKA